jgi:hypothetical protein
MSEQPPSPRRPTHRSPSYPAINLEQALQRTRQLFDEAGRHPAPVSSAVAAWGYKPTSSGGRLAVAALKKFGLAVDEGSREARKVSISKLGRELLVYDGNRDSAEWKERAQKAALMPKIHKDLWTKYEGSLPSDGVIRPYLELDLDFSPSAAGDLLKEFRQTIEFAKLTAAGGSVSENGEDADEDSDPDESMTPATLEDDNATTALAAAERSNKPRQTVQVTYAPNEWALVQAPFPLTRAKWASMMAVLEAMSVGLVEDDAIASDD